MEDVKVVVSILAFPIVIGMRDMILWCHRGQWDSPDMGGYFSESGSCQIERYSAM